MMASDCFTTPAERAGRAIETDAGEIDAATAEDLRAAVDALEAVEWADVPSVSTATAAVFAQMLRRAAGLETGDVDDGQATCRECGGRLHLLDRQSAACEVCGQQFAVHMEADR